MTTRDKYKYKYICLCQVIQYGQSIKQLHYYESFF